MSMSLEQYLQATERLNDYRVEETLKQTDFETTERVVFIGASGSSQGPFVRKKITQPEGSSIGLAYQRIYEAQQRGLRFLGIPRIIECLVIGDTVTVVTEFVPGETLDKARATKALDTAKAFGMICDAVTELHERFDPPIIHRDIKPSNIIVSEECATLIDFGIARSVNDQSAQDTTHLGTRDYAPPEQFGFIQTDERSDIYTLGLVLYFLLSGREPSADFKADLARDASISDPIRQVINAATEFDPAHRYATVRQLKASALAAFGEKPSPEPLPRESFSWRNPLPDNRSFSRKAWCIVRNTFLTAAAVVMTAASCASAVHPQTSAYIEAGPFPVKVLLYLCFVAVPFAAICYLLADKEPLRRRFPLFARIKGKTEILYSIVTACASLLVFVLIAALLAAAYTPGA